MMYKKLVVILCVLGGIIFSNVVKADASDVSLTLCDDSQKDFILDMGQEKDFCFTLKNKSERNYEIKYGFTQSIINQIGRQLCDGAPSSENDFAKIFTKPEPKNILVKAGETTQVNEKIRIPLGMTGVIYGCISYTVNEPPTQAAGSIFGIVISRTLPLKIFVGKVADIVNGIEVVANKGGVFGTNNKIKATMDEENNLNLSFLVQNKGNIEQNIIITGKVTNMLGFEKIFSVTPKKIGVGESSELIANVGIIPFYKGFFTVKFNVENTPIFGFVTQGLDEKATKVGHSSDTGRVYIFSWITLVIIVLLILFIIKILPWGMFKKKAEKTTK